MGSSNGTIDGGRKKRGWKWWLGALLLLGICSGGDSDRRCSVGDKAFLHAINRAAGQWAVGEERIFLTSVDSVGDEQAGVVQFSVSVAAANGWNGDALGSVRLRKCRASVVQVQ